MVERVTEQGFPFGLRCIACDCVIANGHTYSEHLYGFAHDVPIVEVLCVPCGISGAPVERLRHQHR